MLTVYCLCVVFRDPTGFFIQFQNLGTFAENKHSLLQMQVPSVPMIAFETVFRDFQRLLYSQIEVSLVSPLFSLEKRLLDGIKTCEPSQGSPMAMDFFNQEGQLKKKNTSQHMSGLPDLELYEQ